ncbi:MAG TPA: cation-transporting P-type ATPase [Conexivisphaerales archaeon]|nr:cation-transporting P-type ATPase [Conexivisphaerales archaeon]
MSGPWSQEAADVAKQLDVDPSVGLSTAEAEKRLRESGPNSLEEGGEESFFHVFLELIREPMILLLFGVGIVYSIWGSVFDAVTIFVVIFILVFAEVFNDYRTDRTIAALKKLAQPTVRVLRAGKTFVVPSQEVVPGDVILLKSGERVSADARLVESFGLQTDESALTGESVPRLKDARPLSGGDVQIGDRNSMVYSGTLVVSGRAKAVVTATGMSTEIGRIAGLAKETKEPRTPLQSAMAQLSGYLVYLAVFFSFIIPLLGYLEGRDLRQMILTGLSLAFAVIPEELPIIITVVLALGALALSKRHALIKRLRAAETLGDVTAIVTDKTGTLTENRLRLSYLYAGGRLSEASSPLSADQARLLEIGSILNDLEPGADGKLAGDPMELAILTAAQARARPTPGPSPPPKLLTEYTFDIHRKLMTHVYENGGGVRILSKGAPEALLARSTKMSKEGLAVELQEADRTEILGRVGDMAGRAQRVIAYGFRDARAVPATRDDAERELTFLGLAAFEDPLRPEAREAIRDCERAGIRVIMVTGDYEITAKAVAESVGIDTSGGIVDGSSLDALSDGELREVVKKTSVFARASPEHKLRLVDALKADGEVVAVTGDGVNDAPALRRADIGVAMGQSGTDVAKEAADMILLDDNFVTVKVAVAEGRKLYDNLRKGVRYYLSCKVALVSIFLLPILLMAPLPFAPIQIILLELFMDLAASSTFVSEPPEKGIMERKPRDPRRKFMDRPMIGSIVAGSGSLFLAVSLVYFLALNLGRGLLEAQTMAFGTWMIGHVLLALNMRTERAPVASVGYLSNKAMIVWAFTALLVLMAIVYVPWLQGVLRTTSLSAADWGMMAVVSVAATFWMEAVKLVSWGHRKSDIVSMW